eukprot:6100_1
MASSYVGTNNAYSTKAVELKSTNPFDIYDFYDVSDNTNEPTNNDKVKLINDGKKKTGRKYGKYVSSIFNNKTRNNGNKQNTKSSNVITKAFSKAKERGQKLSELKHKSDKMHDTARTTNDLAKQLANKSWF